MKSQCAQAVLQAAAGMGRKLTDTDLRGIDEGIKRHIKEAAKKNIKAGITADYPTMLKQAGEAAANELIAKKIQDRRTVALTISSKVERWKSLDALVQEKGMTYMQAMNHYTAWVSDGRGGAVSMEKMMDTTAHGYMSKLENLWQLRKDGTFMDIAFTREGSVALGKELRGEDSGNPKAREVAASIKSVLDEIMERHTRRGGKISKLEDWGTPQALDPLRLIKMGEAKFIETWRNLIDGNKMVNNDGSLMNADQITRFLKESYGVMATDGKIKEVNEGGVGSIATRHGQHRQLHYKSAEAWQQAMDLAGNGNLFDNIESHIRSLTDDIVLMEHYGPNSKYNFEVDIRKAADLDRKAGKWTEKSEGDFLDLRARFDSLAGAKQSRWSLREREVIGTISAVHVASKLGSLVAAQIGDLNTTYLTAKAMEIPLMHLLGIMGKMAISPEYRSYARSMGFAWEQMANSIARQGDAAASKGLMSNLATMVVNGQGANMWNKWLRSAFGVAMMSHISDMNMRYANIDDMGKRDQFVMKSKGVTDADWALWKSVPRDADGNVSLRGINEMPLAEIEKLIPEKIKQIYADNAEFIASMEGRIGKDNERMVKHTEKFEAYKAKIQGVMDAVSARADGKSTEAEAYRGKLQAMISTAEARHTAMMEMAKMKSMDEVRGFLADFASAERAGTLEATAFERGEIDYATVKSTSKGETLGYRLGRVTSFAETQLRNADAKIAAIDKKTFAKATEFEKRIDKRMAELDDLRASIAEQTAERQRMIAESDAAVGNRVREAAFDFRQASAEKWLGMSLEETHMAVLDLSASTKESFGKGDEMTGLMLQFLKFPWGFYKQHILERMQFAAEKGESRAVFSSRLMASSMVFGGASLLATDVVKGNDPREAFTEERWKKFALESFLRGGGAGVLNSFIEAASNPDKRWGDTKILGPTVGTAVQGVQLAGNALELATSSSPEEAAKNKQQMAKQAYELGISLTPGQNLWMIRAPLHNVLLHDLRELADPGYMERTKKRAEKYYGQGQWLSNDGMRAPNFGNIVEQQGSR